MTPAVHSAVRGVGLPKRFSLVVPLKENVPRQLISYISANSYPYPNVPEAGIIGFAFLMAEAKRAKTAGVAYLAVAGHQDNLQTADIEAAAKSRELLDSIESPLIRAEIDARIEQGDLTAEVVIDLGENNRRSDEAALHERNGDQDRLGAD